MEVYGPSTQKWLNVTVEPVPEEIRMKIHEPSLPTWPLQEGAEVGTTRCWSSWVTSVIWRGLGRRHSTSIGDQVGSILRIGRHRRSDLLMVRLWRAGHRACCSSTSTTKPGRYPLRYGTADSPACRAGQGGGST